MIAAALSKDEKLTDEDRKMLEEARKYPITFDEDSPELIPEMEKAFRLATKIAENVARQFRTDAIHDKKYQSGVKRT